MATSHKGSKSTWHGALLVRALVVCALSLAVTVPVLAQSFGDRFPLFGRQRQQQSAPFFPFFSDFGRAREPQRRHRTGPAVDVSRAPAPKKTDKTAVTPTSTIIVFGDSMADWLAYGLENVLSETPEIGVVRQHHANSGLIRYDSKDATQTWAKAVRKILAGEKANAVVMMVGLHDRISIREQAPPEDKKPKTGSEQPSIAAPERTHKRASQNHEFRSEKWVDLYTKHIDETIAALKSRGVPVFWVSLPPIRGKRSTSDMAFLDDLYRARADKAAITYVDIWDGFAGEQGKYVVFGPDFEGQNRRLRTGDGVHFTKAGALKLAHYVEREIKRVLANKLLPVALPAQDDAAPQAAAKPGHPAPRPLAGPVVPLSATSVGGSELLGGGSVRLPRPDPVATRVLVKGEAAPPAVGRADDFAWPHAGENVVAEPPAAKAVVQPATAAPAKPAKASPAPEKKPTAMNEPRHPHVANGRTARRRNTATVAGQPVLRPPGRIP